MKTKICIWDRTEILKNKKNNGNDKKYITLITKCVQY